MGGIFSSSLTPQGNALGALYNKVVAANTTYHYGITTLRIPENFVLLVTDNVTGISGEGPDIFGSGPTSRLVGNAEGSNSSGFGITSTFVGGYESVSYGPNYWTEDLTASAGKRTTTALASVAGLSAGQTVCVRYGADPTDGGLAYFYHYDIITHVDTTTNVVMFRDGLPENVSASAGINVNRLVNKHDILVLDKFCDGFKIGRFATHNVHVAPSFCRGVEVADIFVEYGTQCFSITYDENCLLRGLDGFVTKPEGLQCWFIQGWSHTNLRVEGITATSDGANVFVQESQNRNTSVRGARIMLNANPPTVNTIISLTPENQPIRWYDVSISGSGVAVFDPYSRVTNLDILGESPVPGSPPPPIPVDCNIDAGHVDGVLNFRGVKWNSVVAAPRMSFPLIPAASGTRGMVFNAPIWGLARRLAVRVTTTTGLILFYQNITGVGTSFNILPYLAAGQFVDFRPCHLLGQNYPGGYGDGTSTPGHVTWILQTDTTMPAGSMAEIDSEWYVTDDPNWVASQYPATVPSTAAPSFNAAYIGQRCLDTTGLKFYEAIQYGYDAADWVAL